MDWTRNSNLNFLLWSKEETRCYFWHCYIFLLFSLCHIYIHISNHIFFKLVLLPCFLSIALWKAKRTNIICIFHHFVPLCPLVTWLFPLPEKITKLTWWESCVRDYWEYIHKVKRERTSKTDYFCSKKRQSVKGMYNMYVRIFTIAGALGTCFLK